jgi:hypothetical protein
VWVDSEVVVREQAATDATGRVSESSPGRPLYRNPIISLCARILYHLAFPHGKLPLCFPFVTLQATCSSPVGSALASPALSNQRVTNRLALQSKSRQVHSEPCATSRAPQHHAQTRNPVVSAPSA